MASSIARLSFKQTTEQKKIISLKNARATTTLFSKKCLWEVTNNVA